MARDPYNILQVAHHAEPEVIEAAYRRLARKYHPDQNPSANATAHMQDINWAYQILKDPAKRAKYDQGVSPQAPPKPKPPPPKPKPPPARPKPRPTPQKSQTRHKPYKAEEIIGPRTAKIILIAFAGLLLIVVPNWISTSNSNIKAYRKEATRKAQLIISATVVLLPTQTPAVLSQPIETVRIINPLAILYNDDRYPVQGLPYGVICNKLGQDTWETGMIVYEIECPELNVKGWVWSTNTK